MGTGSQRKVYGVGMKGFGDCRVEKTIRRSSSGRG